MANKYLLVVIYLDGNEEELFHEGSYESINQRVIWYKNNSDVAKINAYRLVPELMEEFK